jgi:hypothetical protein
MTTERIATMSISIRISNSPRKNCTQFCVPAPPRELKVFFFSPLETIEGRRSAEKRALVTVPPHDPR